MRIKIIRVIGEAGRVEFHLIDSKYGGLIDIELDYGKACESALEYEPHLIP